MKDGVGNDLRWRLKDLAEQVRHAYEGEETQRFMRGRAEVNIRVRHPHPCGHGPDQLHQILWDLCKNAPRCSAGALLLTRRCGRKPISDRPMPSMMPSIMRRASWKTIAPHVFEPFVSRDSMGTGLGFYVPRADDVMLAYQSTSFHDALYLREVLGLRPAPEFEAWLNRMGIFDGKNALAGPRLATPLLGTVRRLAEDRAE